MSEDKTAYRQIIKVTSIFGGVQFINLLISLIRTKIIAILIGPLGIGIATLLNSTIDLIIKITSCGIETSVVREIANENNKTISNLGRIVVVLRKLTFLTGLLAFSSSILFSEWLSKIFFGNEKYYMLFVWVSIALFIKQIINGELAILQGLRRFKDLARANLLGSFLGIIINIPLFYFFKIDAIVPSIIVSNFISFLLVFYFSRKVKTEKIKLSFSETLLEGKQMIQLGLVLSLSGLMTLLSSYLLQIFINKLDGMTAVGYYSAGFTILNSYVGLIFAAMTTDYFPRLTSVIEKKEQVKKIVFEQAYIAILIITPIIVFFLSLSTVVVKLLYSSKFLPITVMLSWGILGMLFKAVSWSMGYILIAQNDSNIFVKTAIGFNAVFLGLNAGGYYFYGFEGIGISFLCYYIFHFFTLKYITKQRYDFQFEIGFFRVYSICIVMCFITFALKYIEETAMRFVFMLIMMVISLSFSLYHLNKKLVFREILNSKINKKR